MEAHARGLPAPPTVPNSDDAVSGGWAVACGCNASAAFGASGSAPCWADGQRGPRAFDDLP